MEITTDRWLGGRLSLRQPRRGYRAGMDAALLAAVCDAGVRDRVLELGCGAGAALLAAAMRRPGALVIGLERDRGASDLARRNILDNGLGDRAFVIDGDVADGFAALDAEPFDQVLANPPFFDDPGALRGPRPERRGAWIADEGIGAWIDYMSDAARDGGALTLIHRAERIGDILARLELRCGSIQIRPVHPFADAPAKRVLVRAVKGARAPVVLLPALVMHPREGAKHTPQAEAILRGEAALAWL